MNRRQSRQSDDDEARWARTVLGSRAEPGSRGPGPDAEAWRATWGELELPPAPAVPAGFARRVAVAWEAERERASAPLLGAVWMRAAAAAALLAGIALGSALSLESGQSDRSEPSGGSASSFEEEDSWAATLSEEYLVALAAGETALATPAAAEAPGADEAGR